MSEQNDNDEDRQLEATEKRIQTAREEGQFPQSRDLTTLIVLLAFGGFLFSLGAVLMQQMVTVVQSSLSFNSVDFWEDRLAEWALGPLLQMGMWVMVLLLPIWFISMLTPLALVKFKPVFAFQFNASKLDPVVGMGRLVSMKTFEEVLKNLVKVVIIFTVLTFYLLGLRGNLTLLAEQDFVQSAAHTMTLLKEGFVLLMIPILVAALIDIVMQVTDFNKRMRMSPEEMKKEFKESEGSPELRARLRQRQRQIATSRMMSALEKADVVLANPDHYSVALRYDPTKMAAPIVVAKGVDELALRIQSVASEHGVPIARIPPLARLMHQRLKVGEPIPSKLFEAVARVLAWAYEMKENQSSKHPLPEFATLPTLEELKSK